MLVPPYGGAVAFLQNCAGRGGSPVAIHYEARIRLVNEYAVQPIGEAAAQLRDADIPSDVAHEIFAGYAQVFETSWDGVSGMIAD